MEAKNGDVAARMKDSIVRGRLLQLLYDRREEGPLLFGATTGAILPPGGIDERAWLHALAQLADYGFVRWRPRATQIDDAMMGDAEITEKGVDVCEGRGATEIGIRFDC